MLVSALEGHEIWAPHYDSQPNPLLAIERRVLRHLLAPIRAQCFLDVACGTGRWMTYLAERGGRVIGVDLCREMLSEAQRKPFAYGRLLEADAASLPLRSNFADTVLCCFAAGYLPDLHGAFSEMARAARPGAKVIVSDLHPDGVAAGWTRSFRLGAESYEMRHFAPSVEQFRTAAQKAGLRFYLQMDACFGEPERPLFRASGKEQLYFQLACRPAVWIGVWVKA